jgi:hypothetical protein
MRNIRCYEPFYVGIVCLYNVLLGLAKKLVEWNHKPLDLHIVVYYQTKNTVFAFVLTRDSDVIPQVC